MTDIAKLKELRERVIAATGPDRELDAEIFIVTTPGVSEAGRIDRIGGVVGWWPRGGAYESARDTPKFTSSIDAIRALVRRTFPNACITTHEWAEDGDEPAHADCGIAINEHDFDMTTGDGEAATVPLAMCIAFLSALISQAERAGE